MIFKSKSISIQELNVNLCKDIPLEEARILANNSRKNKIAIPECQRTATAFTANKAFYTQFNNKYYLILVYTEHANVIPIPFKPLEHTWDCYRHDRDNEWKWWSMGWGLPMMIESLFREFNCNTLDFNDDCIIGTNKKHLQYVLAVEKTTKFPKIYKEPEPPKVKPKPVETTNVEEIPPEPTTKKRTRKTK